MSQQAYTFKDLKKHLPKQSDANPCHERVSATVFLKAIDQNLNVLLKASKQKWATPMVKANAYGHGSFEVSEHLQKNKNVAALGVASFEEAFLLKLNRIKKPIWIFSSAHPYTRE